jgi:hypothetical protein
MNFISFYLPKQQFTTLWRAKAGDETVVYNGNVYVMGELMKQHRSGVNNIVNGGVRLHISAVFCNASSNAPHFYNSTTK